MSKLRVSAKTKAVKNARGRRASHAARLTTAAPGVELAVQPGLEKKPRGVDVRERVLSAALECFGAFGFAGTSTRAVAERAGLSHPLLLYHFQSKEQLWRSTMEDVISRYRSELDERVAKTDPADAAAGLRAFIENFVEFSARVPQLHRIMTQQSTQGSDRIHWLIESHLRESFVDVCALVRRAQASGQVRDGDPARLYYAVVGLAGTLLSVSTEFRILTDRDVFAKEEMRRTIEFIFAFLFLPPAGKPRKTRARKI